MPTTLVAIEQDEQIDNVSVPEEQDGERDDPQDCVRQYPALSDDMCELVGFDLHGVARIKVEVARQHGGFLEPIMLRYMRERFGQVGERPMLLTLK